MKKKIKEIWNRFKSHLSSEGNTERKLLTIDLTEPLRQKLVQMQEKSGAKDVCDLLRRSLANYDHLLDMELRECQIMIREPNGVQTQFSLIDMEGIDDFPFDID